MKIIIDVETCPECHELIFYVTANVKDFDYMDTCLKVHSLDSVFDVVSDVFEEHYLPF